MLGGNGIENYEYGKKFTNHILQEIHFIHEINKMIVQNLEPDYQKWKEKKCCQEKRLRRQNLFTWAVFAFALQTRAVVSWDSEWMAFWFACATLAIFYVIILLVKPLVDKL